MLNRFVAFFCFILLLVGTVSSAFAAEVPQLGGLALADTKVPFSNDPAKVTAYDRLRANLHLLGGEAFTSKDDLIMWMTRLSVSDKEQLMTKVGKLPDATVYMIIPTANLAAFRGDRHHHEETSSTDGTLTYTTTAMEWCAECFDWKDFFISEIISYALARIWEAICQCEAIKTCYMCHSEMSRTQYESTGACPTCGISGLVDALYYCSNYATFGCICGEQFFVYP